MLAVAWRQIASRYRRCSREELVVFSSLTIENARTMQMEISCIRQKTSGRHSFAERVPEAIDASKVVKNDRAANYGSISNDIDRRFRRSVVVGVNEAQD